MVKEKRLIDANQLPKQHELLIGKGMVAIVPYSAVENAPTVDAVGVLHGRIEDVEIVPNYMYKYRCSCCKSDVERWYKYCPNCGAKMDK